MKIFYRILLFSLFISNTFASLYFHPRIGYHSSDSEGEGQSYSNINYGAFFGATFNNSENFYIGMNLNNWSREFKGSSTLASGEVSLLEMGPMIGAYFSDSKNIFISFAYNMYAQGERKTVDGDNQDVSGKSMLGRVGFLGKLNKQFFIGIAINYHSVSLAKSVVDNTESDITDKYSVIYPSIELSIRFR